MTENSFLIQISAPQKVHINKPLPLRGKFNVPYDASGLNVTGPEVIKHIVLVVTRGANYQTLTPFRDVIVFTDDIKPTAEGCSGHFNLDVFEKISFDGEGDYYILCSLGVYTSNIVRVVVS